SEIQRTDMTSVSQAVAMKIAVRTSVGQWAPTQTRLIAPATVIAATTTKAAIRPQRGSGFQKKQRTASEQTVAMKTVWPLGKLEAPGCSVTRSTWLGSGRAR